MPVLGCLIPRWVEDTRMMMAEFGIEGLARLGTDAALATIDALALRYEPKKKRVATAPANAFYAAAERQGLTADELGDRIVPWLGFTPGQPRIVDCGGKPFKVEIGPEWKLATGTWRRIGPWPRYPGVHPGDSGRVQGACQPCSSWSSRGKRRESRT